MSLLSASLALAALVAPGDPLEIHVDPRGGDDHGDGSVDRPFATIHRALALQSLAPERPAVVHLGLGHFGADRGETLPILLPANVRVVGAGSKLCEVVGVESLPVFVLPASGAAAIESLLVRGGSVAIVASKGDAKSAVDVALADVAIEESPRAIDLAPARGRLSLRGDGLRVQVVQEGLVAAGAAELELKLHRCRFTGGSEGIEITTDGVPEEGPSHALELVDCSFEGHELAGLVRRGKDGRHRAAAPWRIEGCSFRGGHFGVSLEAPGGDVPVVVRDCRFEEAEEFGLSLAGSGAERPAGTTIEGCRFRWNGTGAQCFDLGGSVAVRRCRFEDSVGAGLVFGSLGKAQLCALVERCLLARNGAAGVSGLCVGQLALEIPLHRCTIADNAGSGVKVARGDVVFPLSHCIVAGNRRDLDGIADDDAKLDCFVGGDPGFVDRAGRDWRLRPDSPARAAGGAFE